MESINLKIGSPKEYEKYLDDAKNKKMHLVCIASIHAESYCSKLYRELVAKEQHNKFEILIEKVNKIQDVGCLYPIANLSIIPSYDYNAPENESKIKHDLKEIIFQANEKLIKTDTIVFLLDSNTDIYDTLSKGIYDIFIDNKSPWEWLRTIILAKNY